MERVNPLQIGSRVTLGVDHLPAFLPILLGAVLVFVLLVGIKYARARSSEFHLRSRSHAGWGHSQTRRPIRSSSGKRSPRDARSSTRP